LLASTVHAGRAATRWRRSAKAQLLDFCAVARDPFGNKSADACAPLKVT
jgi:hypothetical protein